MKSRDTARLSDVARAAAVALSTATVMHIPTAEIGRRAAERLLARLEGRRVRRSEELPVELFVRMEAHKKAAPGAKA